MSDLQDIREYNAYHLADRADCGEPSSIVRPGMADQGTNSPGADFLESVRTDFLERFGYAVGEHNGTPTADDIRHAIEVLKDEAAHEIADSAVPVYTYQRWQTFTDLAAWQEDLSDHGEINAEDLTTSVAGVALYMIAERLVVALADELDEWADDIEANEDDDLLDGYDYDSAHRTVEDRDVRVAELNAARPDADIIVQMSDSGLYEVYIAAPADDEETDEIPGGRTVDWTRNEDGHYTGQTSDGRTIDDLGSPFETIEDARAHLAMLIQDHQL